MALEPYDQGLLGTTRRYPYEVRNARDYFSDLPDVTLAPDLLSLARHILDSKAAAFDPAGFRDRYEEALLAHLEAKQAGMVVQATPVAAPSRVINLMDALRQSIAEGKKPPAQRKGVSAAPVRERRDGRSHAR